MSDHREYRDDIAAYVLGALDTAEKLEVERHLAGCEECSEYLFWLDPAVDLLPASVEPLRPSSGLKRSLMASVSSDLKVARRTEREHKRAERGLWGSIWRPVTAGVLSTVLIAGALGGYLIGGNEPESVSIEAVSSERIGAEMEVTLVRQGDEGTLQIGKLPGLTPEQEYQAWIRRDGEMEPSNTFDIREDGNVDIEGSLEGAEGVYITREPEGGSETPTSRIIMGAPLS
ncbi:MAG: anti-sigma factor [Actinomycetota bacterium]|nr:anti-sigma factor [Actinomycetota bacterium]